MRGIIWLELDYIQLPLNTNNFRAELRKLEKVLGLFAREVKNLCLLGSATHSCLKLPPVKL